MFSSLKQFLAGLGWLTPAQRSADLAAQWLRADDDAPQLRLNNAFAQSTWVYACVSAVAQQVAHIPLRFSIGETGTRSAGQPLLSGALVDLFARPHPQFDRFLFWETIVSWLLLRGKAFVAGFDRNGNVAAVNPARTLPAHLLVLNPDRLTKVISDHQLEGYRYQPASTDIVAAQDFLPEEVISIRLANPFDCCEGQAPAAVAALAAETDFAAAQFMKGLMLSNADTGLLVTVPHEPSTEQKAQFLAALRERRRRAGTPDRPLFLWANAKVEKPSISMVDIEFLENRKFSRQEICAIFKTPQELLGFTEDANRAVAETARLTWIENTIAPLCERLAAAFVPLMQARDAGAAPVSAWFDMEALPAMQKARRERFRTARQGFEMGVPVAVLNQLFDLGLPRLPHDDQSYLPGSFQPVPDSGLREPGRSNRPQEAAAVALATRRDNKLPASEGPGQAPLRSRLSRFFFEQRGRVLARCAAGARPLLEPKEENELLRKAVGSMVGQAVSEEYLSDINATTIQLLEEALADKGACEGADCVRRVFQSAARERAPMLARLLARRHQPQPLTTQ